MPLALGTSVRSSLQTPVAPSDRARHDWRPMRVEQQDPTRFATADDFQLLVAVAERQVGAVWEIYGRYALRLYRLASELAPDPQQAEGAVLDALVSLWREPSAIDLLGQTLGVALAGDVYRRCTGAEPSSEPRRDLLALVALGDHTRGQAARRVGLAPEAAARVLSAAVRGAASARRVAPAPARPPADPAPPSESADLPPSPADASAARATWRAVLAPYEHARLGRSLLDLATSIVPYLALTAAMYWSLAVSVWLTLALALPAAGFLLRTFVIFHDCTHGSFLASKRANQWLGTVLGLVVCSPFTAWRHDHAIHHATAGDLDRRGVGDVPMLTVAEYRQRDARARLGYRLFRHPLVMFGVGPLWAMVISPRLVSRTARPRVRNSVLRTDAALLVLVGALCVLLGWRAVLLVQLLPALLAGAVGIWLFYVQHQFEDTWWETRPEWTYAQAALHGSSHLRLPRVLQFFSANIGLHHVHHLSARIPNYNLQRAHEETGLFDEVPELSLRDGLRATRLKLWDEREGRLVTFAEARDRDAAAPADLLEFPTQSV